MCDCWKDHREMRDCGCRCHIQKPQPPEPANRQIAWKIVQGSNVDTHIPDTLGCVYKIERALDEKDKLINYWKAEREAYRNQFSSTVSQGSDALAEVERLKDALQKQDGAPYAEIERLKKELNKWIARAEGKDWRDTELARLKAETEKFLCYHGDEGVHDCELKMQIASLKKELAEAQAALAEKDKIYIDRLEAYDRLHKECAAYREVAIHAYIRAFFGGDTFAENTKAVDIQAKRILERGKND